MSLQALIDLANKAKEPISEEERAIRNKAFEARMRKYDLESQERLRRSTPSLKLLNKGVGILD
jgi:hypothetical protein